MPATTTAEPTSRPASTQDCPGATDAELVPRLRNAADSGALAELVRRYQGRLYGFAVKLTRDREIAADICQQTWLKLLEAVRAGGPLAAPGTAFQGWLFTIARNYYIDVHVRGHAVSRTEYLGEAELDAAASGRAGRDDVESTVHLRQLFAHLLAALDNLPATQRTAVTAWASGETAAAAARLLALPRDTLLSRKKYAFTKLKLALEARGVVAELVG